MRARIYKRIILSALIIGAGTILWANDPKEPDTLGSDSGCKICLPGYCGWPTCEKQSIAKANGVQEFGPDGQIK